jgi:hypothetical protein
MDRIAEIRLFVDKLDFVIKMFESCLGFQRSSNNTKMVATMQMKSGTEIILYDSRQVYTEGDNIIKIIIDDENIDKLRSFLDTHQEKYFYKEKHEYGVARVLNWQMDNGSMIDFSSLE